MGGRFGTCCTTSSLRIAAKSLPVAERGLPAGWRRAPRTLSSNTAFRSSSISSSTRCGSSCNTIPRSAIARRKHGNELLQGGFTIAQVVRDYGDICQTITDLAVEKAVPITTEEFRTLNLCLDDAIAGAVTEYGRLRAHEGTERLGRLAHELRNLLNSGLLAFGVLKTGSVGIGGSTGAVLARSLAGLARLIDRELAEVRLGVGVNHRETVVVREFIEDVEVAAMMDANARGVAFSVVSVAKDVTIHADRQILTSVVANLLQNAFKFTRSGGHVTLRVHATADRVLIDVEDECGGLPPGKADELFRPFEQRGSDRTGLGLGLGICDRGVRMNGGELHVLNRAGTGCVFTVELPRLPQAACVASLGREGLPAGTTAHGGSRRGGVAVLKRGARLAFPAIRPYVRPLYLAAPRFAYIQRKVVRSGWFGRRMVMVYASFMRPGSGRVQRVACGLLAGVLVSSGRGLRRRRPKGHGDPRDADASRAAAGHDATDQHDPQHQSAAGEAAGLSTRQPVLPDRHAEADHTGLRQCADRPEAPRGQRDDRHRWLRLDGALLADVQAAVRRLHAQNPSGGFGVHMFFGNFIEDLDALIMKSNLCGKTENQVLDVAQRTADELVAFMGDGPPGPPGFFPSSPLVEPINYYLTNATQLADPTRTNYLVIITDGVDNCFGSIFTNPTDKPLRSRRSRSSSPNATSAWFRSASWPASRTAWRPTSGPRLASGARYAGPKRRRSPRAVVHGRRAEDLIAAVDQVGSAVGNCRFSVPAALDPTQSVNPFRADLRAQRRRRGTRSVREARLELRRRRHERGGVLRATLRGDPSRWHDRGA